jgi:hypothetical protein
MSSSLKGLGTVEQGITTVTDNIGKAEMNLMVAYALKDDEQNASKIQDLANSLGVRKVDERGNPITHTLRSLQLIAETIYQTATHVMNMFTSIIDKMDQMKKQIIQKFSQS